MLQLGFFALIFVFFVVVGHALMVSVLPRNPRFWKSTDYVWLAIASLGIIGATQRYTTEQSRELAEQYRAIVEGRVGLIRTFMLKDIDNEKYAILLGEDNNLVKQGLSRPFKATEELRRVVLWQESVVDCFDTRDDDRRLLTDLSNLVAPQSDDGDELAKAKAECRREVADLNDAISSFAEFKASRLLGAFEARFAMSSPWLLCLAIAIRATKVSAEVFGYDKPLPKASAGAAPLHPATQSPASNATSPIPPSPEQAAVPPAPNSDPAGGAKN